VIASTAFPSAGTYRCLYTDGVFKVSKIGEEFKVQSWTGTAYTVATDIKTVLMNSSASTATCTLPAASLWPGREVTIKNIQTAKNVQVVGVSASDESLIQGRGAMTVKSDGTSWNIINFYKRNLSY
jgi:hypothetical protein